MEGASDFFVEECVFGELFDGVVGADGDLAHGACAGVLVEHGEEELFVFGCAGVDDAVVFELEADAFDFSSVVDGGE